MVQENMEQVPLDDESQQINRLKALIIEGFEDNVPNEEIIQQVKQIQQEVLDWVKAKENIPWTEDLNDFEKESLAPLQEALSSLREWESLKTDVLLQWKFAALADAVDSYQDSVDKKQEFKKKADKEKQNKMLMKTQYGESRDGMVRAAAKQGREDAEAEVIDDIKESNLVPEFLKKRILAA